LRAHVMVPALILLTMPCAVGAQTEIPTGTYASQYFVVVPTPAPLIMDVEVKNLGKVGWPIGTVIVYPTARCQQAYQDLLQRITLPNGKHLTKPEIVPIGYYYPPETEETSETATPTPETQTTTTPSEQNQTQQSQITTVKEQAAQQAAASTSGQTQTPGEQQTSQQQSPSQQTTQTVPQVTQTPPKPKPKPINVKFLAAAEGYYLPDAGLFVGNLKLEGAEFPYLVVFSENARPIPEQAPGYGDFIALPVYLLPNPTKGTGIAFLGPALNPAEHEDAVLLGMDVETTVKAVPAVLQLEWLEKPGITKVSELEAVMYASYVRVFQASGYQEIPVKYVPTTSDVATLLLQGEGDVQPVIPDTDTLTDAILQPYEEWATGAVSTVVDYVINNYVSNSPLAPLAPYLGEFLKVFGEKYLVEYILGTEARNMLAGLVEQLRQWLAYIYLAQYPSVLDTRYLMYGGASASKVVSMLDARRAAYNTPVYWAVYSAIDAAMKGLMGSILEYVKSAVDVAVTPLEGPLQQYLGIPPDVTKAAAENLTVGVITSLMSALEDYGKYFEELVTLNILTSTPF